MYLDADTIISGSISDLFSLPFNKEVSLYAVEDVESYYGNVFERLQYSPHKKYICAGVLMMNLNYWRDNSLTEKIIDYSLKNNDIIQFPDQDAINFICQDSKRLIPLKYDILNAHMRHDGFIKENLEEIKDALDDPRIIHYAGSAPWVVERNIHFMQDHFFKYNTKLGYLVKSQHLFSGLKRIKYNVKWMLQRLGIANFYKPILTYKSIKKNVDRIEKEINL